MSSSCLLEIDEESSWKLNMLFTWSTIFFAVSAEDIAMSAIEFDQLSDEEAKEKLPYIKVIARATPQTKLRIVRLAQELGLCVAMTGKQYCPVL